MIYRRRLSLALLAFVLSACASLTQSLLKPELKLSDVRFTDPGLNQATLVFTVDVRNPNRFPLKFSALDYDLSLQDRPFAAGTLDEPTEVPAEGSSSIRLPVKVRYLDLFSSLTEMIRAGKASYGLKAGAHAGPFRIPLERTGEVPLPGLGP